MFLFSQEQNTVKLSPSLVAKAPTYFEDSLTERKYILNVKDTKGSIVDIGKIGKNIKHIKILNDELLLIITTPRMIQRSILRLPQVVFIDEQPAIPFEEEGVSSHDFSVNAIYAAHHFFPEIDGKDLVVSVKENRMNPEDIDLKGRYQPSSAESPSASTHATVITTLIAGAGNSFFKGQGVAPESKYASADFATALPDTLSYYQDLEIVTQNHSYGIGIQNYYGAHARAFDLSVNKLERLTHVFSAGNSGNLSSSEGIYAGIQGYANLTGNMKMSKNAILVGAVDSLGNVPNLSSKGPAYDGRIKPDLVAFAEDGTSGSAALVSGASILLQDQYREIFGDFASSDLVRALLINSADEIANQGPDYISGFGKLNVYSALTTLKENHFFQDVLVSNGQKEFSLPITENIRRLKITLCWNDTASSPNAPKALVNDLDLELYHVKSGQTWLPWVPDPYPNLDSLKKPAIRKKDSLNNNEQIIIDQPPEGTYIIRISCGDIQTDSQAFSVTYLVDTLNSFTWTYPTASDAVFAGKQQTVRWLSSFPGEALGTLEFTVDGGLNWQVIQTDVILSKNEFSFLFPDTIATGRFRMRANSTSFLSDNFPVSPILDLRVGFICDSVLLYWNKPFDHNQFRLFGIQNDSLQQIAQTGSDNFFTITGGNTYYAVAPLIGNLEGRKSYTINYATQGVGCYINNFLADLTNSNQGELRLSLGSLYKVQKVEILKSGKTLKTLFTNSPVTASEHLYIDTSLQQGLNIYQAFVELEDGTRRYSEKEVIYYNNNKPYLLFPNPVQQGTTLQILVDSAFGATALIYNAQGMLVKKVLLEEKLNEISTTELGKGVYFMRVVETGGQTGIYRFVVL